MLNQIQRKLLDMLCWFHNYCIENEITYYAVGGTMIGSLRHKGFIPWDDDIDIAIPRKDYMRLIKVFKGIKDGYILESPYDMNNDYLYSYSKLYDTRTTLVEKTRKPCKRGVYIDIFPLDGIGNTFNEAVDNFKKIDRKNMLLMAKTCVVRKDRAWYKNASIYVARLIPNFLCEDKQLSISIDQSASSINKDNSIYVANLMGAYRFKEITKREYFGTPTLYSFENIKIFGPEKYDKYLSGIYGNWRQLPPIEKRYTKHDFIAFDLNKPYSN